MHPHPADFYVAHQLFTFHRDHQEVTQWGSLTDGPADRADVLDSIREMKITPTLAVLRVYHFRDDAPARDVTEDMIAEAFVEEAA